MQSCCLKSMAKSSCFHVTKVPKHNCKSHNTTVQISKVPPCMLDIVALQQPKDLTFKHSTCLMSSTSTKETGGLPTSMAAKAVAVVAKPAVESAKIGLVCRAIRPCPQAHHTSTATVNYHSTVPMSGSGLGMNMRGCMDTKTQGSNRHLGHTCLY